jgi:hypothetical protein
MLLTGLSAAAMLAGQETAGRTSVWTKDVNGARVEGSTYSYAETPKSSQRVETSRSINGRNVPLLSTEDKVLHEDSQSKIVERVIRKYGPDGHPGPPITVHIEEKKGLDGSSTVQSSSYETDINGNKQLFERATTQIRKSASTTESSTTVERATLNGALQTVERDATVERKNGDTTNVESTSYHRDISGNFTPFSQEVKQTSKSGGTETSDTAHYELNMDGKLTLGSRSIDHVKTNPDGSQTVDTDVYSRLSIGRTTDTNADAPRLQEQIRKERTPGPGGVMVETISVRARLPNDPSRFGAYEKVSQTTTTNTDPGGHKIETGSTTLSRRDPNGDIVVDQGMVNQTVTTKK